MSGSADFFLSPLCYDFPKKRSFLLIRFHEVGDRELPILYRLNRHMAESEGQAELFTAEYASYREAFVGERPPVRAWFLSRKKKLFGFVIWQEKFASYTGRMALYVEDLWMGEYREDHAVVAEVLEELLRRARETGYSRVEIRRLEWEGIDRSALEETGFAPVEKWRVWRRELIKNRTTGNRGTEE